jgi:hypothetical protein
MSTEAAPRTVRASTRLAALAGAIAFVLIGVQSQLRSAAPAATDGRGEVVDYLVRHHDRLQLAAVLLGFAMSAALVWLAGLVRTLRDAQGAGSVAALTALGGGVLAAASTVAGALIAGTTATRFAELGPGTTRAFWTMFLLSTGATLLGLMLVVGGTAVVSAQTRLFAPWFTAASALLTLASVAGAFTIAYDSDAIQAVAGVAVLLDSIWIAIVSLFMWRGAGPG